MAGRYRDDVDREHSRHFDRKVDAQRWLDVVAASTSGATTSILLGLGR